jgi:sugar O-acyltransferase (sialic acid O-acetyltransferase NeuD family)
VSKDKNTVVIAGIGFPELNEAVIRAHQAQKLNLLGFIDDRASEIPAQIEGFPVIGDWTLIPLLRAMVINSIFKDCRTRKRAHVKLRAHNASIIGINAAADLHSTSLIDETSIILPNVFMSSNVRVGAHSLIHRNAFLAHDVAVGENCFIGPGVMCLGKVTILDNCYIGAGAVLSNGTSIAGNSVIAAGSVVFNDVFEGQVVMGNPAIIVGVNNEIS